MRSERERGLGQRLGAFDCTCAAPSSSYPLSPAAIGARYEYILSSLLRLVPVMGILPLLSADRFDALLSSPGPARTGPDHRIKPRSRLSASQW
eukprot:2094069-Pyramimonas_sp.AAC.1